MNDDATVTAERRHERARETEHESTRAVERDAVRELHEDAAVARERCDSAARQVERHGDDLMDDLRREMDAHVGDKAQQWLDECHNVLEQSQRAAQAFFRLVEASLQSDDVADRQLAEMSDRAARALEDVANALLRESELVTERVADALDADQSNDALAAMEESGDALAASEERFDREMSQLNDRLEAVRLEASRLEAQREQARREARDADDRRADERREELERDRR